MVRQLTDSAIRASADCTTGDRYPRYRPAMTTASTPEPSTASAAMKARYGVIRARLVSRTGDRSRDRMNAIVHPIARPTATPPTTASRNSPTTSSGLSSIVIAAIAALSATSAAASFKRLSPSSTVTTRRGSARRPVTEVTATVSVGAMTAANANAAAIPMAGSSNDVVNPMTTTVNATVPTERTGCCHVAGARR